MSKELPDLYIPAALRSRIELSKNALKVKGDLSPEEFASVGDTLAHMEGALQWWVGDWAAWGENRGYGDLKAAIEQVGLNYQTVANLAVVSRAFEEVSRRAGDLSFSHHAEVTSLSEKGADEFLARARDEGWSRRDLRKAVAQYKAGPPVTTKATISEADSEVPKSWKASEQYGDKPMKDRKAPKIDKVGSLRAQREAQAESIEATVSEVGLGQRVEPPDMPLAVDGGALAQPSEDEGVAVAGRDDEGVGHLADESSDSYAATVTPTDKPGHVASSTPTREGDEQKANEDATPDVAGPSYFEMWLNFVDRIPEKDEARALLAATDGETRKAWRALSLAQQNQVRFCRDALMRLVALNSTAGNKPEALEEAA